MMCGYPTDKEGKPMIFMAKTYGDLKAVAKYTASVIKAPYVRVEGSALGGLGRSSLIIRVSLDPKTRWHNGIYHNSRYAMFHLNQDGSLELFSKRYDMPKMRAGKVKGMPTALKKIQDYLDKARKETRE
jgi:hypothetical protein